VGRFWVTGKRKVTPAGRKCEGQLSTAEADHFEKQTFSVRCTAGSGIAYSLTESCGVEPPQGCGQSGGEAYPSEVGHEEESR
jgi:hypothetical protein